MQERRFRYFGLQFYGECWSGDHAEDLFATKSSKKCIGHNYATCADNAVDTCTGDAAYNYVYEIVYEGNYHCSRPSLAMVLPRFFSNFFRC